MQSVTQQAGTGRYSAPRFCGHPHAYRSLTATAARQAGFVLAPARCLRMAARKNNTALPMSCLGGRACCRIAVRDLSELRAANVAAIRAARAAAIEAGAAAADERGYDVITVPEVCVSVNSLIAFVCVWDGLLSCHLLGRVSYSAWA